VEETYDEPVEPKDVETDQSSRMSVDMILMDYPVEAIDRLRKLVDSKAVLPTLRTSAPPCRITPGRRHRRIANG